MHPTAATFVLAVIIGSVREGRFGPVVAGWFVGQAKQRDDVSVDIIDLADTPIPSANFAPRSAPPTPSSSSPRVQPRLPRTAENRIDSVGREWQATMSQHECRFTRARSRRLAARSDTSGQPDARPIGVRGEECRWDHMGSRRPEPIVASAPVPYSV